MRGMVSVVGEDLSHVFDEGDEEFYVRNCVNLDILTAVWNMERKEEWGGKPRRSTPIRFGDLGHAVQPQ